MAQKKAQKKQEKAYTPPKKILEKYADVIVNFSMGNGKGIKKGDTVYVRASEFSKPLYVEILRAIWKKGGNVIQAYSPDNVGDMNLQEDFFSTASSAQIDFCPMDWGKGLYKQIDHTFIIIGSANPHALSKVDPKKMMQHQEKSIKPIWDIRREKEAQGELSWALALYGSQAMADEAGLSLKEYWDQIIKACYLKEKDPVAKWKQIDRDMKKVQKTLNKLDIDKLHIEGEDVDLWITLGEKRQWLCSGGNNLPSFEHFTSPDWRGTEGWIRFNRPLYRHGTMIEDIRLEFKKGKVVKATAKKGEKVLKEMIKVKNGDRVGEFSMTDKRFSKIDTFMAETLFDENFGGKYGNTHVALGHSFREAFNGDKSKIKIPQLEKLGFNQSAIHDDIISASDRTVTAYLKNGKEEVIYKDGMFTFYKG